MSKLHHNQQGLILTLLIIAAVVVLGFIAWQNFLESDQGQQIQETADQIIDTIENTKESITQ